MKKYGLALLLCAAMLSGILSGCSGQTPAADPEAFTEPTAPVEVVDLEDEALALADTPPALPMVFVPLQGPMIKATPKAEIDYSNIGDGYVIVKVTTDTGKRWKAQVKGPTTAYTYNLTAGELTVLPLSDGNGDYKITVYENASGTKYAAVVSKSCTVALKDEFLPFLYPNQYVNYTAAPNSVAKAAELTADAETELEKVAAVYDYVVGEFTYDKKLAKTVTSGYLPDLDKVLEKKTGICFDYAAMMTGMLRSQGVPCKLVVGYAGTAYHAWISVWTEDQGWIDNAVYFDGAAWQRMDPTFASSGNKSSSIMKYIGDGSNYTEKYFY